MSDSSPEHSARYAPAIRRIAELMTSDRSGDRLRAMDLASGKRGGAIVLKLHDPAVVPILLQGLGDRDLRVQRAAARGLRPWIAEDRALLEAALGVYAGHTFDGRHSHAGLLDTNTGEIWIPRFAAMKGHAALLPDADTDRYFRFDFFVPGQGPSWIHGGAADGHLLSYFVPEWSYSEQRLIAKHDERGARRNGREQARLADKVVDFYRNARLPYDVRVHRVTGGGGLQRARELDVDEIKRTQSTSPGVR